MNPFHKERNVWQNRWISFPRSIRGNEAQIKIGNRKSEIGNKLEPPHADGCESSAVVSTASCGGVSPPATTPDETSGEPAGEDARATHAARSMAAMHDFNSGKLLIRAGHSTRRLYESDGMNPFPKKRNVWQNTPLPGRELMADFRVNDSIKI